MSLWDRTRRNHGLEHATISLLLSQTPTPNVFAGNSVPGGFFVYGDVPTDALRQSADSALSRMQAGERDLAISPFCGTNILVSAALATLGTLVAFRIEGRGPRGWLRAFSNATWAIILSRPLGRVVQRRWTTSADMEGVSIKRVSRIRLGRLVIHWVATSFAH